MFDFDPAASAVPPQRESRVPCIHGSLVCLRIQGEPRSSILIPWKWRGKNSGPSRDPGRGWPSIAAAERSTLGNGCAWFPQMRNILTSENCCWRTPPRLQRGTGTVPLTGCRIEHTQDALGGLCQRPRKDRPKHQRTKNIPKVFYGNIGSVESENRMVKSALKVLLTLQHLARTFSSKAKVSQLGHHPWWKDQLMSIGFNNTDIRMPLKTSNVHSGGNETFMFRKFISWSNLTPSSHSSLLSAKCSWAAQSRVSSRDQKNIARFQISMEDEFILAPRMWGSASGWGH